MAYYLFHTIYPILFVAVLARQLCLPVPANLFLLSAGQFHIPDDVSVVIYCRSRNSFASARVAAAMRKHGVQRVQVLAGGLEAWKALGPPKQIIRRPTNQTASESKSSPHGNPFPPKNTRVSSKPSKREHRERFSRPVISTACFWTQSRSQFSRL